MKSKESKKTKGPNPDILKIEDMNWKDAVKKAVKKKKPKEGWPEPEKKKKK